MFADWKRKMILPSIITALAIAVAAGIWWYRDWNVQQKDAQMKKMIWINDAADKPAADFRLTDQNGKPISLSEYKGKVVVLQFMDPVCTDICPIVSQEAIMADREMGDKSKQVEFIAVNVNEYHLSQQDVMQFSQSHGLNTLPNWHFVTGDKASLQAVWKAFGIEVIPNPDGDVEHSADMYFIDKQGKERYVAYPDNDQKSISQWGKGIAYFAEKLM